MKKLNWVLLVLTCVMIIVGCTGTPPAEPDPVPAPTPAPAPAPAPAPTPAPEPVTVTPVEPVVQPPVTPAPVTPVPRNELVLEGASNHSVALNESLSRIAARFYGESNMFYFPLIRLANNSLISDPDIINPDIMLVVPDLQSNLNDAGARALLKEEMLSTAQHYERLNRPGAAAQIRNLADNL